MSAACQAASPPAHRPTDRRTDGPTDRPTDRPTYQPTDRPTDRLTNRLTDRPTDCVRTCSQPDVDEFNYHEHNLDELNLLDLLKVVFFASKDTSNALASLRVEVDVSATLLKRLEAVE